MSDFFLGETRLMSFNFAPKGWAMCNGSILSIQQNAALFSLLGTMYGGNGVQTFGLPDLRGRVPIGWGTSAQMGNLTLGQIGGTASETISLSQLPSHIHLVNGSSTSAGNIPPGNFLGGGGGEVYNAANNLGDISSGMIAATGGNQPHSNLQPYLVMTWVIALTG